MRRQAFPGSNAEALAFEPRRRGPRAQATSTQSVNEQKSQSFSLPSPKKIKTCADDISFSQSPRLARRRTFRAQNVLAYRFANPCPFIACRGARGQGLSHRLVQLRGLLASQTVGARLQADRGDSCASDCCEGANPSGDRKNKPDQRQNEAHHHSAQKQGLRANYARPGQGAVDG